MSLNHRAMKADTPRARVILLLIVLLGAGLRLFRLDSQSVWYDESFSVAHSVRPLARLFQIVIHDRVQPPLHYIALHEWFHIAGYGSMQARLLSAVFGTLSILLLYLLARRFTDSVASLVAAFLLAISQIAVYFSQEARPYAQAQFLSLFAALMFLWFLEEPDLRRTMAFALVSAALLYTHYYGAGTLLALGMYWLIFRRDYSPLVLRRLALVVVLVMVAYLPWIVALQAAGRLNTQHLVRTSRPSSVRASLYSPATALTRFNNGKFASIEGSTTFPQMLLGLAIFTLPAAGALWFTWHRGPQGALLGWLLAAVPVVLAIVVGTAGVTLNYRHYSFAAPGYYLAVALGWRVCFQSSASRIVWLVLAVGFSAFALRANYFVATKPDYRAGFLPLAANYHPGDCVTARPRVWRNQVHFAWEVYYRDRGTLRLVPSDSLSTAAAECARLWLVWDRTWWMNLDPDAANRSDEALAKLGGRYKVVERFTPRLSCSC